MIPADLVHLANHLWQSTLFAAAVWLTTLALRRNRAAVRHSLWLAASLKFLIPFSLLVGIGSRFQWSSVSAATSPRISVLVQTIGQPFGASGAAAPSSLPPTSSVSAIFLYVWIFGFVANILWWAIRWLQLRQAVRHATPLNLNVPISVLAHQGQLEPGVFGIFRPVLLLPAGITDRLTPGQLQAVLAHEFCHVRRRDNLTAAIHMFVEALFWFHPLVWWIRLRLIDEQERACDEEVLRLGGDPQVYAESILKVCECYLTSSSMCVSGISSSNLKGRIGDIMRNRGALKLSLSRTIVLAIAAIAALAGPIVMGTKAGPLSRQTAQLQTPQTGSVRIAGALQGGPRQSATPPGVFQAYRIGEIRVTGARLFQDDVIRVALGLVSGEVFNQSQLARGFQALKKLYGNRGYVNFLPMPEVDFNEQQKVVNLDINIDEGAQFVVNRISFTGNTKTPSDVLRREIVVKEGEVFNASSLELSMLRLNQLGFFEEIKPEDAWIQPLPDEAKVDINLRVREKAR